MTNTHSDTAYASTTVDDACTAWAAMLAILNPLMEGEFFSNCVTLLESLLNRAALAPGGSPATILTKAVMAASVLSEIATCEQTEEQRQAAVATAMCLLQDVVLHLETVAGTTRLDLGLEGGASDALFDSFRRRASVHETGETRDVPQADVTIALGRLERQFGAVTDTPEFNALPEDQREAVLKMHSSVRRDLLTSTPTTPAEASAVLSKLQEEIVEENDHPCYAEALANVGRLLSVITMPSPVMTR